LATYAENDESAMIAFEYDDGRVFLSGPHPEWEEDSARDNSIGWDAVFDDFGSEWPMMLKVSLWLLENSWPATTSPTSTTTPSTTDPIDPFILDPMVIVMVVSWGILFVAAIVVKRR
jgi:hypothetical protein